MPVAGLEPARCCQQQILSLPRLPFRHTGMLFSQPKIILTQPDKRIKIKIGKSYNFGKFENFKK